MNAKEARELASTAQIALAQKQLKLRIMREEQFTILMDSAKARIMEIIREAAKEGRYTVQFTDTQVKGDMDHSEWWKAWPDIKSLLMSGGYNVWASSNIDMFTVGW